MTTTIRIGSLLDSAALRRRPHERRRVRLAPGSPLSDRQQLATERLQMTKQVQRVLYRQGDVLLERIEDEIPTATLVPRDKRGVVLAEGEVTGHAHRIASRHASLYRTETDARYMRVMGPAPVALKHEEHSTVELPPGNYKITIHAEYQPGELPRQVAD